MELKPNWKAIILIDVMLCVGIIIGLWFINKPFFSENLPIDFDWLAIYISNVILVMGLVYFSLDQYCQLKTKISENGIYVKKIFGNKFYRWENLSTVEFNLYVIDLIFYHKKVQLLPYLFENREELFDYLNKQDTHA